MKTIYKYTLTSAEFQTIEINGLIKVLSVAEQKCKIVVYALIEDTDTKITKIEVAIAGTGYSTDNIVKRKFDFLGTVNVHSGMHMFHIFYRKI